MILGVGIDLVEVSRIEASIKRLGRPFLERIGRETELKEAPVKAPRRSQYWAARFAAKEAFAKAFGTGIGQIVTFRSVGVIKFKSGKPELEYSPDLERILRKQGITRSHLTLTHTDAIAAAVVILEGPGRIAEPDKGRTK